jgi:hypothetical protein
MTAATETTAINAEVARMREDRCSSFRIDLAHGRFIRSTNSRRSIGSPSRFTATTKGARSNHREGRRPIRDCLARLRLLDSLSRSPCYSQILSSSERSVRKETARQANGSQPQGWKVTHHCLRTRVPIRYSRQTRCDGSSASIRRTKS